MLCLITQTLLTKLSYITVLMGCCLWFQKSDVDFYIDVHAHSTLMNGFMYGNIYEDMGRFERQAVFPKLLCANADDFSLGNTTFNRDTVKAGTGRRWVILVDS